MHECECECECECTKWLHFCRRTNLMVLTGLVYMALLYLHLHYKVLSDHVRHPSFPVFHMKMFDVTKTCIYTIYLY